MTNATSTPLLPTTKEYLSIEELLVLYRYEQLRDNHDKPKLAVSWFALQHVLSTEPNELPDNELITFYGNMPEWYKSLPAKGKRAAMKWIKTGDIAPALPYMPETIAALITEPSK